MKRVGTILIAGVLSIISVLLPLNNAHASVDDFSFSNFNADYYLTKDSEGRSNLKVVETLTAEFPNFDQNKGINRAIPSVYDGHTVSFHLDSLLRNGQPEPVYSQTTENGNVVIATGGDNYLRGTQVYQLTYTLRDVIKDFGDHQEFYWDTNGTGWSQVFNKVTATVHFDDSSNSAFSGDVRCLEGIQNSNQECIADKNDTGVNFSSNGSIRANENVTMVLKFHAGTFTNRPWSILDSVSYIPLAIFSIIIIVSIVIWIKFGRNAKGRGTIIPQYLPPKDISVLMAGELYAAIPRAVTSQIIDLTVRHNIRLIESQVDGFFGKSSEYSIELLNSAGLTDIETEILTDLFGSLNTGQKYTFKKSDVTTGQKLQKSVKIVSKSAISLGYRQDYAKPTRILTISFYVAIIFLLIGFVGLNQSTDFAPVLSIILGFIAVGLASIVKANIHPLTDKGREVYDYLKGLEMYIKLAEADRMRVLQSPQGSEKVPVDLNDNAQVVKLYERVLPYAVLFGQEKQWVKELSVRYDQMNSQPDWYSGSSAFNAAVFASSISGFTTTATNFSSPSSSNSSGFGGGGFSGGGGGGGGGGGR
ncbi:MAG: DUF2207 domain-containing protein [Candidatus Saccharimonadales bacterium]